jgi:polyhydroxyalkanoate synthesis regulator phasin
MSLKGKLEAFYLASVLQLLSHEKKTGVLQVSDGDNIVKIFVKDGIIVYASSSQREFRLAHLVRIEGIVPAEEVQKCLLLAENKKQSLGNILVEKGYISKENLRELLQHQVKEILNSVFLWKTGEFEYKDVPFSAKGQLVTQMNTLAIILEASRLTDEWSVITKQINDDSLIFKASEKNQHLDEVRLDKKEWRVLSLIDGIRPLKQVVKDSGLGEFVTYKTIYTLLLSGFIEKSKAGYEESKYIADYSDVVTTYNDILLVVYRNLEAELGDRAFAIFDKCKTELVPKQRALLKAFEVRKDAKSNVQAILEDMSGFKDFHEGRVSLVHSFNSLLVGILGKAAKLVGQGIIRKTLKEIEQLLSYVKEFQTEATEKIKIVYEIENILAEVGENIGKEKEAKAKTGRVSSLLRLK